MAYSSNEFRVPPTMKAWVLGGPDELSLLEKPVPEPGPAEVLLRIDAIAVCATDLEIIRHGTPAGSRASSPFTKASPQATSTWEPLSSSDRESMNS